MDLLGSEEEEKQQSTIYMKQKLCVLLVVQWNDTKHRWRLLAIVRIILVHLPNKIGFNDKHTVQVYRLYSP